MKKFICGFIAIMCAMMLVSCSSDVSNNHSTSSDTSVGEDEYKAACQTVDYKELCRYPDNYSGTKICVKVEIQQIIDTKLFSSEKAWRGCTDNDGYGFYYDDEYYLLDKRSENAVKILVDDIVVVYGEFTGLEKITRSLTNTKEELPCIEVKYADIVEDTSSELSDVDDANTEAANNSNSAPYENSFSASYEDILEEYSEKLRSATPTLIEEYNNEAANNSNGLSGLAELCNDKVTALAEISTDGMSKMAEFMYESGSGSYSEYEEWAGKLQEVYMEEAGKIQQVYMDSAI